MRGDAIGIHNAAREYEVTVPDDELAGWSTRKGLWLNLAFQWARYAPRGKGAVPRAIRGLVRRRVVLLTEHGAKLAVSRGALDTAASIWSRGGTYEPGVVDACVRLLRPGETFYDIGANMGLVSLEIAQQVPDTMIIGYEPQADLAHHVAISAGLNGFERMRVFRLLLSDRDTSEDAKLFVPAHKIHASLKSRSWYARVERVPQIRLDTLVSRQALPAPDVVKIDVEGAELMVLEGARDTFKARPASIVFESDINMQRFGYDRAALQAAFLKLADYSFWFIPPDRSPPRRIASLDGSTSPGNYIALAPRHSDRLGPAFAS